MEREIATAIHDVQHTIAEAVDVFCLDRDGFPELIPTGLAKLDRELGGLGPGSCGIIAAATGVGKSSTVLAAMLNNPLPVGCVSVEDGPDVVGTRLLSAITGIDSLRIRRKDLSKEELKKIQEAAKDPGISNKYFAYPIAGSIAQVEEAITELCEKGCRLIFLDYIQEVRGHNADRRNEVGEVMTRAHRAAARGKAALFAVSQFRRFGDSEKVPQIYHLKESGDLENKARVIVLAHKIPDEGKKDRVQFRLAKSTYGGEHIRFQMVRDSSGTLRDAEDYNISEDW